jgi:hypothetical protein
MLDQLADAVGVVGLVSQQDGTRVELIEQQAICLSCVCQRLDRAGLGPCALVVSPPRDRPLLRFRKQVSSYSNLQRSALWRAA